MLSSLSSWSTLSCLSSLMNHPSKVSEWASVKGVICTGTCAGYVIASKSSRISNSHKNYNSVKAQVGQVLCRLKPALCVNLQGRLVAQDWLEGLDLNKKRSCQVLIDLNIRLKRQLLVMARKLYELNQSRRQDLVVTSYPRRKRNQSISLTNSIIKCVQVRISTRGNRILNWRELLAVPNRTQLQSVQPHNAPHTPIMDAKIW